MNKIMKKRKKIKTEKGEIDLELSLLNDCGDYKILAETNSEVSVALCGTANYSRAEKMFDTVWQNDVTAITLTDVIDDLKKTL